MSTLSYDNIQLPKHYQSSAHTCNAAASATYCIVCGRKIQRKGTNPYMEYTWAENTLWWKSLSQARRREIIERMVEVTGSEFSISILNYFESGWAFSAKQLAAIRKWDR